MNFKSIIKNIINIFNFFRFMLHIVILITSSNKKVIFADIKRWSKIKNRDSKYHILTNFLYLLKQYKEYRTLFYYRIKPYGKLLSIWARPQVNLFLKSNDIGSGLFIQHGFSTTISAKKIGKNCWINQQVTIGYSGKHRNAHPTIGNNVKITAGAKVIGDIIIGDNCIIGANSVVVKDVPDNCTVVGIPAYIIRQNGTKVRKSLK